MRGRRASCTRRATKVAVDTSDAVSGSIGKLAIAWFSEERREDNTEREEEHVGAVQVLAGKMEVIDLLIVLSVISSMAMTGDHGSHGHGSNKKEEEINRGRDRRLLVGERREGLWVGFVGEGEGSSERSEEFVGVVCQSEKGRVCGWGCRREKGGDIGEVRGLLGKGEFFSLFLFLTVGFCL
ncbi:hypothetical protein L1049_011271 [Liquidambar formosana]|uniref:Uncharacterized protein n=1 Tax=Liquidambar formosana TaxID=63359 RepID=A0AAP0X214_LIQFO